MVCIPNATRRLTIVDLGGLHCITNNGYPLIELLNMRRFMTAQRSNFSMRLVSDGVLSNILVSSEKKVSKTMSCWPSFL